MDDELLIAYFKGEVSDEEAQQITEWIEAKIEHQRYYQQLCRLFEVSYWIEDIPEQTEVAFPKKTKALPWKHYVISFMKVAAIFVLGFALHFFLNWQKTTHHELQHQIHVPTGQHVEIMLADGSKVWLNSGSTLTFPSKFNGKKRMVELDGEGFFEVKSDKEHPFIVSTSKYQVKAVGTSFNIYDYQDSPQFEAALLNGKVEVTTNAKKSSVVILTPNQRAALCQGVLKVKPIENANNYLWRKGILYFNEPLLEVFDKLQEYYDIEFQIRNSSLTRKSPYCTGKFRAKDGLEHIIRVLK
ncbi:FecR domain-containing protein, partial [Phocaeicola vulgatus]